MSQVAIIGCGPAGMLAAHAASLAGRTPIIFAKEAAVSPHAKATFLHAPIPDLTSALPDEKINIFKVGSEAGYAQKVYGDHERATSWAKYAEGELGAWALAPVYADLWALYGSLVKSSEIGPGDIDSLVGSFPVVVNTAPAWCLCGNGDHGFHKRDIWVEGSAPASVNPNSMTYNGSALYDWYRSSDIFGVRSMEYSTPGCLSPNPPNGIKVVGTDCDCNPRVFRAGRWGTWRPGVLLHHAFERTSEFLNDAM